MPNFRVVANSSEKTLYYWPITDVSTLMSKYSVIIYLNILIIKDKNKNVITQAHVAISWSRLYGKSWIIMIMICSTTNHASSSSFVFFSFGHWLSTLPLRGPVKDSMKKERPRRKTSRTTWYDTKKINPDMHFKRALWCQTWRLRILKTPTQRQSIWECSWWDLMGFKLHTEDSSTPVHVAMCWPQLSMC